MRNPLLALFYVAVMTAKLCGPGGVRAVIAENLLLKQQLIVLRRGRRRAPNLTLSDYRPIPGGTGPSWLSFIGHTRDSLWSVDLFRCESIVLQSYWVLVVMDQFTRRLVGIGVHRGAVTGADLCRMFNAAIHDRVTPRHLSTDHDPLFEAHRWTANLRILEIDEIKTVAHVPLSHPFVERLIGTVRREFLANVLFWNARDLERKLGEFQTYYNAARCHASLKGHTPATFVGGHTKTVADLSHVRWVSHCRDLVQLPVAA